MRMTRQHTLAGKTQQVQSTRIAYRFCRCFCRWFCMLYFRARCFGTHNVPRRGGTLLVCNHQSFMDPVLVGIAIDRECGYMARETLFHNPWFGRLIAFLNAYPVKRNTADLAAIKESLRRLKAGGLIVLFPEGTRTPDGRIQPLLPGIGAIARKAAVPIVPTLIDGMTQLWPRGRAFPGPGDVIVEYGKPIMPADYAHMSLEELMELIRHRLLEMQRRWHGRVPARRLEWYRSGADG